MVAGTIKDGYISLASTILAVAINDYRKLVNTIRKCRSDTIPEKYRFGLYEYERLVESDEFEIYCGVAGVDKSRVKKLLTSEFKSNLTPAEIYIIKGSNFTGKPNVYSYSEIKYIFALNKQSVDYQIENQRGYVFNNKVWYFKRYEESEDV